VKRHFQALPEIPDFTEMLGGNATAPVARPPSGSGHKLLDGPPLHVSERVLNEVIFE
jgi:hypothetical protein